MRERHSSILVVDDDVDSCQNISDILSDLGYHVEMAHNGLQALEKVRQRSYDAALLDLKMPDMDGITLYREIRKLQASAVALVVTAFAGGGAYEQALSAGAWKVLSKPVDLTRLLNLVQTAVEQPLVMIVDDDTDLCSNLWDVLREHGFRIGLAHNTDEAAERLRSQTYRVVLIDMKLPGGDGASVYQLVRSSNPEARTVVITGYRAEMEEVVEHVISEGADAICYKPFDVPTLLAMLQRLSSESGDVQSVANE